MLIDLKIRQRIRPNDKLAKIRELCVKWVEIALNYFNPEIYVAVDEQLNVFRGRCPFCLYMSRKPTKCGTKF